jgi:large repetitive protein
MRKFLFFSFVIFSCIRGSVFAQTYEPSYATTTNNSEVIGRVLFGEPGWTPDDIVNPSETGTETFPCTGYSDFTIGNSSLTDGNTTDDVYVKGVQKGFTYELEVQGEFCGSNTNTTNKAIKVYIDYNDDGDFLDATEDVWTSPYDNAVTPLFTTSITIPLTATSVDGELRMRIIYNRPVPGFGVYLWENLFTPSTLYAFGETEDYTLILTAYIESIEADSALCFGASDGAITITPDPTAPIGVEYSTNGLVGPWTTTLNYTGLSAGTYSVWGRFQNDPTDPASITYEQYSVTIDEPADITFDTAVSDYNGADISCAGENDGEIYITSPLGGWTGNYTYDLTYPDASVVTQANGTFIGLVAGDYDVAVLDDNGCESTITIILEDPTAVSYSAAVTSDYNGEEISCFGACDGELTITPTGGTPGFTYQVDGVSYGANSALGGLCAGDLVVLMTDTNGCYIQTSIPITEPEELIVASANITSDYSGSPISCNGASDGEITITASGGVPNYTYSTSGGAPFSSSNISGGLSADSYDVIVQDANSCVSAISVVNMTEPAALDFDPVTVDLLISCNGEDDGKITLSAAGGVGGYDYSITGGAPFQDGAGFAGLSAGTYQIAVQDDNGCEWSESYELTEPDVLQFTASVTSNYNGEQISCYQGNDGVITVIPIGGTQPYVYDINGGIPATMLASNGEIPGLSAGAYSIVLSDLNDCPVIPASIDLVLTDPEELLISQIQVLADISCFGESDGSLLISAVGGTGDYTYYAGGTYPASNTNPFTITGMNAGTYNVTVEDDNGCSSAVSIVNITTPAELVVTVIPSNLGCNGDESGSASLNITGGFPNFDYSWSNGQSTDVATDLSAGSYSVTVTDANNCSDTEPFSITQPVPVTQVLDVNCFGDVTGEILVTINDPNPISNYSYSWDDPGFQTTALAVNLAAGTYTVYVSDQFDCILTATDSILQPDSLGVFVEHTSLCQYTPFATAVVHASGGIEPYDYDWSTLEQTTSITILNDGSYSVTVTDDSGCQSTHDFVIDPLLDMAVTFTIVDASCADNTDGAIIPNVTGGYPPFDFEWSNYTIEPINSGVGAGIYSVDIYDSHGCLLTDAAVVGADPSTCLEVYSAFTPNGDENNDYWHIGNIELYPDAHVEVFNRWGDRVFAGKRYANAWDGAWTGTFNGNPLPSATYYYVITLNNGESPYKGTVTIVR